MEVVNEVGEIDVEIIDYLETYGCFIDRNKNRESGAYLFFHDEPERYNRPNSLYMYWLDKDKGFGCTPMNLELTLKITTNYKLDLIDK